MMGGSARAATWAAIRVVLNSVITSPNPPAEIKVRDTAHAVSEQDRREHYSAAVREQIGWQPVAGQFILFIGPQLTPTSLGLPQAASRLVIPDS